MVVWLIVQVFLWALRQSSNPAHFRHSSRTRKYPVHRHQRSVVAREQGRVCRRDSTQTMGAIKLSVKSRTGRELLPDGLLVPSDVG